MKVKFYALLIGLLWPLSTLANPQNTAELVEQWITLEVQKGHLQKEWVKRREGLDQRIQLLDIEEQRLNEILNQKTTQTNEVDQRRAALLESQNKLEIEQQSILDQIGKNITQIQKFADRLPDPLKEVWVDKLLRLNDSKVTQSEKIEALLSSYKALDEFNQRIALHQAPLQIKNSQGELQEIMVTQMYLGHLQGWYINDTGTAYGYGRATPQGWVWWHNDETKAVLPSPLLPGSISKTRKILEHPMDADYISLPVNIQP